MRTNPLKSAAGKATLAGGTALAALVANPAAAQVVCFPGGVGLNCTALPGTGTVILDAVVPVAVTLPDGLVTSTIDIESTGPIVLDATGTALTSTIPGVPALSIVSGDTIDAQITAVSTTADGSTGALLRAADDAILVVDDTVTTLGDFSNGINIVAGSVAVSVDEVRTVGIESDGVELVALSGPATLDADLIETLGSGSTAAILQAAGDIGVNVGVLRTEGDQALGLDLRSDAEACAILGAGSCDVSALAGTITTDGFGSIGALVLAAGDTDLTVDVLQTGGDEAAGLALSADPEACLALGVGGCDTAFTVTNLTTDGARAPGALVRAVGDIDGSVGVLSTGGEDAIGLDLASDPEACAILGAGACETSFSVGQLTTEGDGAIGALVRAAGPTTANIGVLETAGDDATGVDLALDPEACLVLGIGQCTTALTAERITTLGDGSGGVLINSPGQIVANLGIVETAGVDATAVAIAADPETCILLGAGACSTSLTADRITTTGDRSAGLLVIAPTDVVADLGIVETAGIDAPAVAITADPAACVLLGVGACDTALTAERITTLGDGSGGVLIDSPAQIVVDLGTVETFGIDAGAVTITADPQACVLLGAGACGTDLTADRITTAGDGSAGVQIAAPAEVVADLGVVETAGIDAPAVAITADPAACVLLGVGACDTALAADRITTLGEGSAGVLIAAPADVVADFGVVETAGLNAPAVTIAADPAACVLLGAGACDTTLTGDRITTVGDGSAGVLVTSPGQIVADLGLVRTDGDNAPAITLITDPAACLVLGTGTCGVALGSGSGGTPGGGTPGSGVPGGPGGGTPGTPGGTDVDTDGDNAPGIVVVTPGPVDVDAGNVDTDGNNSPGVVVDGGEGPVDVDFDMIDTDGANSPGVDIDADGPINVGGGTVNTSGPNSPGVLIVGDDGPVTVNVGGIVTTGPNSDGIDVTTTTGNQTIVAGPITVTGLGSNGIDATATGCATVDITARGPISAANGTGIDAESACAVRVTTLNGAPVSGSTAGINVVSGTGATITIGDALSSSGGPALNVDGAAATVLIQPTGTLNGRFDLTNAADTLTNNGTINATSVSNFGGGNDTLVNAGTIRVTAGPVAFGGLEVFNNTGLIDMRDGSPNDSLTFPGAYNGSGAARLGVDVASPAASDRLVIGGAATGSTQLLVNGLNGTFLSGAVVVDAGAGSSATAFGFAPQSIGLTDYSLAFLPGSNDFALYGFPSASGVGAALLAQGAREIFYRGNDAVGAHLSGGAGSGFDADADGTADSTDRVPPISRALWFQGFGAVQEREATISPTFFGQTRTYELDSQQDFFGGQIGLDLVAGGGSLFGVTAGYISSNLKLENAPYRSDYQAANVGLYGRLHLGPVFVNALVKYEKYWVDLSDRVRGFSGEADGDGYGGWIEAGVRFGGPTFFVEPTVSLESATIDLDSFTTLGTAFSLDEGEGIRGKAGARVGALLGNGPSRIVAYAKGQVIHEFEGDDELELSNAGGLLAFDSPRPDTYGRATVGFDIAMPNGIRGFIEGSADFANGVSGGGARGGLSIPF